MTLIVKSKTRVVASLSAARDGAPGGLAAVDLTTSLAYDIADGTAANQANAAYFDAFNIAASGTLNIDLSGTLVDALGDPLVFTCIKELILTAAAGNTNNIIVGNGTNPWIGPFGAGTQSLIIPPGGMLHFTNYSAAGWGVTAATADILKLANSGAGTGVDGTIHLIGER